MATKSALITAVNGFISSIQSIANHRLSMLEIINVLFQTTTTQTVSTGSNVFQCNLNYKKQGNLVYIDGFITNKFSVAKSAVAMITIPNSLFYAKGSQDTVFFGFTDNTGVPVQVSFSNATIYLIGSLAPDQKIRFNLHYQTND